jgi:transposase
MGRPSRYPEQFRHDAVQMALATKDSRASVARRLGVNETTLRNWVANYLAEQERAANPLSVRPSEFEELRRLRREVEELRIEKEILRTAAVDSTGQRNSAARICGQRMIVRISSSRGSSVFRDQASVAAARARALPARSCGLPCRVIRVCSERNARPLRDRTRMSVAARSPVQWPSGSAVWWARFAGAFES